MDSLSSRIFITGASGLVGLQLVEQALEAGFKVKALVRHSSDCEQLHAYQTKFEELEIVKAELSEHDKIVQAMRGSSAVVHTAASILPLASFDELRLTNVEGTRSIVNAALAAEVVQLIHISSLSVIMGDLDVFGANENAPYRQSREAYANSKIAAEKVVLDERIKSCLHVTVLRPGFIYGANEKAWMPRLIRSLRAERAMLVDDGQQETNVIYVGNLCSAILLAVGNQIAFGEIYNLTDGQKISKRQLFDRLADELGAPRVRVFIPRWFAELLVEIACAVAPLAPSPLKDFLSVYSRPALRLTAINQGCDITKAEFELKYTDRIPFEEGMAKTCAYWRTQFPISPTEFKSSAVKRSGTKRGAKLQTN